MNDQTGQMRASAGAKGGRELAVELAAVMSADRAKALAERSLARNWARRHRLVATASPALMAIEPGALVQIGSANWRVDQVTIEQLVTRLKLVSASSSIVSAAADPGRAATAPDVVAAPTQVAMFNLPDLGFGRPGVPAVHVAACQTSAPYHPVQLSVAVGEERRVLPSAQQEAVLGRSRSVLSDGQSAVFDLLSAVEVELDDPEHWLESRDDDALIDGANLAVLGNELFQFGLAEPIGERRFRLSRLLRGRRGTEWAMSFHRVGERFCVLGPDALIAVETPLESVGSTIRLEPNGIADDEHAGVVDLLTGEALRPPSPVGLTVARGGDGLVLGWVRRSRLGWAWIDGVDAPLGEASERYKVQIEGASGSTAFEVAEPRLKVLADQIAPVGTGEVVVRVSQIGDYARSRPASARVFI